MTLNSSRPILRLVQAPFGNRFRWRPEARSSSDLRTELTRALGLDYGVACTGTLREAIEAVGKVKR